MKKFIFLSAIFGIFAHFSFAQGSGEPRRTPEERAQNMVARLGEKITLSTEKQAQLKLVFKESYEAAQAERASGVRVDREQHAKAIDEKVKAILSTEEFVQYEALRQEMAEKREQGRPTGGKKAKKIE
jgi:hypothetical protein